MQEELTVAEQAFERKAVRGGRGFERRDHAFSRIRRQGRNLEYVRPAVRVGDDEIREGAADIHTDTVSGPGFFHIPLSINGLLECAVPRSRDDRPLKFEVR